MDVSLNDVSMKEVEILSTPAVYIFPAFSKNSPIVLTGESFKTEMLNDFLDANIQIPFPGFVDGKKHGQGFLRHVKYHWTMAKRHGPVKWVKELRKGDPTTIYAAEFKAAQETKAALELEQVIKAKAEADQKRKDKDEAWRERERREDARRERKRVADLKEKEGGG
jgi:hypothetical protein